MMVQLRPYQDASNFDRLAELLDLMPDAQMLAVMETLNQVARATDDTTPIVGVFACMVVAEHVLMGLEQVPNSAEVASRLRALAVHVAQHIGQAP